MSTETSTRRPPGLLASLDAIRGAPLAALSGGVQVAAVRRRVVDHAAAIPRIGVAAFNSSI